MSYKTVAQAQAYTNPPKATSTWENGCKITTMAKESIYRAIIRDIKDR